jgi:ABC-type nitrate/sulfonate/bicarbonate transport system permease component
MLPEGRDVCPGPSIPPIAWTPLAGAVFPVFVSTYSAVRNIERTQINAALCLGATPSMLIWDVLIPGALPVIFPGLRIALGVGWMCVVAAELIAGPDFQNSGKAPRVLFEFVARRARSQRA